MGVIAVSDARSLLFVPGNRPDRFERARDSGAGGIILDLEDAVGELEKDMARAQVQRWLGAGGTGAVRVNAVGTPWHDEDLEALLKVAPSTTVMVPKATPESIVATQRRLPLSGQIVALVETAAGVLDARLIAHARGVGRLAFGNVDLGAEIGVDPDNRTALGWARSMLVLASAAAGIAPPLDGVTTSITDEEALAESTVAARSVGFGGKLCIHPSQIATVHRLFAPTQDEIEYAERVLAAATENVSVLDGRMLDCPAVERARRILGRDAGHG